MKFYRIAHRASLLALLALVGCEEPTVLLPAHYTDLPGWQQDRQAEAYKLFVESCAQNSTRSRGYQTHHGDAIGKPELWDIACGAANDFPNPTNEEARQFFETHFAPFQVTTESKPLGMITGYYEPLLHGSKSRQGKYRTPVYGVPDDLVSGSSYLTREEIEAGGLRGHAKVLLYVDDPVMLFFLHIQGSGKVRLADGELVGLQYAAQNGQKFVPIGRILKESGEMDEASMQGVRDWLYAHPDRAKDMMNQNPSYIFFKLSSGNEMAKGALGLPLTSARSVAVDDDRAAYGVPTYIATTQNNYLTHGDDKFERLFVAQDTGGALHGPNRIDVFYGRGDEAEWLAGHQNTRGLVYWLLPKEQKPEQTPAPQSEPGLPATVVPGAPETVPAPEPIADQ